MILRGDVYDFVGHVLPSPQAPYTLGEILCSMIILASKYVLVLFIYFFY